MCKAAVTMDTFLQSLVVGRGSLRIVVDNARYHSTDLPPRLRRDTIQNQDKTFATDTSITGNNNNTDCRWSVDRGSPEAIIKKEAPTIPQRQPSLEAKKKEPPTLPQRQISLEDEQRNNKDNADTGATASDASGEDQIASALQREQERIYAQIQKQRQQKKAQQANKPSPPIKPSPKPLFGVAPKARPGASSLLDFDDDDSDDDNMDVNLYQKAFCTLQRQTSHHSSGERLPLPCPPPL